MKENLPHGKNLKLAAFFILGVALIITISFLWKLLVLINQSRFDYQHQFILEIKGKSVEIVCFTPENHTVSILKINNLTNNSAIRTQLALPIDGSIKTENEGNLSQLITSSIMHLRKDGDINIIDKIKIWWFLQSVSIDNIPENDINVPITDDIFLNIMPKLFTDKSIYQEAKTIEVINATGMSGFASRLARLIGNIGGNVIMIQTATENEDKSSLIYSGEFSYTERRIGNILKLEPILLRKKPVIADIIITIGKDMIDTTNF